MYWHCVSYSLIQMLHMNICDIYIAGGFTCLTEKAHKATVWCVRHLPQNRDIFMTGTVVVMVGVIFL